MNDPQWRQRELEKRRLEKEKKKKEKTESIEKESPTIKPIMYRDIDMNTLPAYLDTEEQKRKYIDRGIIMKTIKTKRVIKEIDKHFSLQKNLLESEQQIDELGDYYVEHDEHPAELDKNIYGRNNTYTVNMLTVSEPEYTADDHLFRYIKKNINELTDNAALLKQIERNKKNFAEIAEFVRVLTNALINLKITFENNINSYYKELLYEKS